MPTRLRVRRKTRVEEEPYYVKLPADAKSPSNGIYKRFDIVEQTRAVSSYADAPNILRCSAPFIVRINLHGLVKNIKSKLTYSKMVK